MTSVNTSTRKIAFVTPTKDRPSDLRAMLNSFSQQTCLPAQVIVVDASTEPVQEVVHAFGDQLPIEYVRWTGKPSAAAQRNEGVRHVRSDIDLVCFFDDDQSLHPDSLEIMLVFWESAGEEVGGAAFNLANPEDQPSANWKRSRLAEHLGLYSCHPGAVAQSGWQSLYGRVEKNTEVDWLSSQAIVLPRKILERFRFDEFFDGYSYLEDLDFSYSISRQYKLFVLADALFEHYPSPLGRRIDFRFGKVESRNRLYIVRKHGLSLWRCYLGLGVRMGLTLVSGLWQRGQWSRAMGNIAGCFRC